ncbi:class II fumarate hydratase [Saccharospirillum alexandrii]|uniref:class II fumarate hydratase n=1 Tax=Saccharospirillum alexandrii TaxID=2448477 RepID=UPI000FD9A278|nr:class II fumarate hydratase [Saccharospirillum alexandrii]
MRIEKDSFGEMSVPDDVLYGAQTARALSNFGLSGEVMPPRFIEACLAIKAAAAGANAELGVIAGDKASAIQNACLAARDHNNDQQFPVDVFQTGSGTSTNMNVNEVVARLAATASGLDISPNDDVNASQSSNDTIPAAIQISTALALEEDLLPAITALKNSLSQQGETHRNAVKTGRTHLMDAMPMTLEQEFSAWIEALDSGQRRINQCLPRLKALPLGGTAIGTGINAPQGFAELACRHLNLQIANDFCPHNNAFYGISTQDVSVEASGLLKGLATSLIKISNDLRWMNSGPLAGLGEVMLPALQPGSSIMPGKVNPVIPEAVLMACYQVIGHDTAITLGAQSGNFQLNVSLPLIARNLLDSIGLLSQSCEHLAHKVIDDLKVNHEALSGPLHRNPILVTALNPVLGYLKAAEIAKIAYADNRPIIEVALEKTDLSREELESLLDPARLAHPNRQAD